MKADLQPSPKNTSAPEALEHSQPLLYALKVRRSSSNVTRSSESCACGGVAYLPAAPGPTRRLHCLYPAQSIAEMPWDTADGTPSPPASPAASRGAASPVTPEGAPRPQPLLPLSVPTAFHIEAQLERYRQAQEALLADTGIIQVGGQRCSAAALSFACLGRALAYSSTPAAAVIGPPDDVRNHTGTSSPCMPAPTISCPPNPSSPAGPEG